MIYDVKDSVPVAYVIRITDKEIQRALQAFPMAHSWDPKRNEACRAAIRGALQRRIPEGSGAAEALAPGAARLGTEELRRLDELFDRLGYSSSRRRSLTNDYAWKAALLPSGRKRILCLGCGRGDECVFLRARFPAAEMTAVDFAGSLDPEIQGAVGVEFRPGDVTETASVLQGKSFDLVFSNHVLEHLYDPDAAISSLSRIIEPGGVFAAGLPLDADPRAVFREDLERLIGDAAALHPMDYVKIDGGHPWKTNLADLHNTLRQAGFPVVSIFQRSDHISRYVSGSMRAFKRKRATGLVLYALTRGILGTALRRAFPRRLPVLLLKLYTSAATRFWFGPNVLKNRFAPEVFVLAKTLPGGGVGPAGQLDGQLSRKH